MIFKTYNFKSRLKISYYNHTYFQFIDKNKKSIYPTSELKTERHILERCFILIYFNNDVFEINDSSHLFRVYESSGY